jgi:Fe-S-cluster containining protein
VNGNQLQQIAESVQNGTLWKLGIDDSFRFSCKQCGRCCVNNTIIVNTYDVIRMRNTLKMTTYEMVANDLLSFNVGPNSGMPIATIRFRRIDDGLSVCPFLAPVYQAKSLEDLKSRIRKGSINTEGLVRAKNCDGEDIFLCSIHPDKPFRCRAYPLGRIFEHNDSVIDIANAQSSWFHIDLPAHCNSSKADHTVREWIESQGMKEYLETSTRCTSMLEKIAKADVIKNEDISALAFMVLYNFDSIVKAMSDEDTLSFIEKSVDYFLDMVPDLSTVCASV